MSIAINATEWQPFKLSVRHGTPDRSPGHIPLCWILHTHFAGWLPQVDCHHLPCCLRQVVYILGKWLQMITTRISKFPSAWENTQPNIQCYLSRWPFVMMVWLYCYWELLSQELNLSSLWRWSHGEYQIWPRKLKVLSEIEKLALFMAVRWLAESLPVKWLATPWGCDCGVVWCHPALPLPGTPPIYAMLLLILG